MKSKQTTLHSTLEPLIPSWDHNHQGPFRAFTFHFGAINTKNYTTTFTVEVALHSTLEPLIQGIQRLRFLLFRTLHSTLEPLIL